MNLIRNGWFSEISDFIPGHCLSLQVKNVLCSMQTKYQNLLIFESTNHGRVLVLDGMIQLTERDEFMFQEMMAMLPLMCHLNPERILIIGGGDGGVAREVLKHPSVKEVVLCELDEDVVEMSKLYLPFTAKGFDDERVTLIIDNGISYLSKSELSFDVIITDSTDPIGEAVKLFDIDYFKKIKNALKKNGIMCSLGEGLWLENKIVNELVTRARTIFSSVRYAHGSVPTYPLGQMGYLLCSNNEDIDFSKPITGVNVDKSLFRYYSTDIHRASFILPNCMKNINF